MDPNRTEALKRLKTVDEMRLIQLDALAHQSLRLHELGHHEASAIVSNARLKMETAYNELFEKLYELGYYPTS